MKDILAFIHIKKTGGISLQCLLAEQYGTKFYGGYTTPLKKVVVVNHSLEKDQLHELPSNSCVCKHWTYSEFEVGGVKERANFITVIREPIPRITSHYNFYLMFHPKGKKFSEYVKEQENVNIYSRFLNFRQ